MENLEYIYSGPELARRWGMNRKSVNRMLNSGRLEGLRVGERMWGIPSSEVIRYEESNRSKVTEQIAV